MLNERAQTFTFGPGTIDYDPPLITFDAFAISDFPRCIPMRNGGGKSTLCLFIAGAIPEARWATPRLPILLKTSRGAYDDESLRSVTRVIPQRWEHWWYRRSVADEVAGVVAQDRDWADHVITQLQMNKLMLQRPNTLSTGERKRAMLAVTLASAPTLLVTDELLVHLDDCWSRVTHDLLQAYAALGGSHVDFVAGSDASSALPDQQDTAKQRRLRTFVDLFVATAASRGGRSDLDVTLRLPYGHQTEVSLRATSGTAVIITGANGSGKTTLLRELWRKAARKRGLVVALVETDPYYQVIGPTVADEFRRASSTCLDLAAAAATFKDIDVLTLSYAERKIVAITAACLGSADVVAVDELYAGLDPTSAALVNALLKAVCDSGRIVVTTSALCNEVVLHEIENVEHVSLV
ncbi:MAG TPA: ATP-binding cassette domain-containing protein [Thermoanaerobaculia bacterium]|jgi:ABC-type multidrug transport system ATPase subunit